jgi:hypothetical protein
VILAAFFCGLWPSVVVLVLSAVAGTPWLPEHELTTGWRIASFFAFIAFAGLDVVVLHLLLQSLVRMKHQEHQLNLLNKELGHRLQNLFTIANAVVAQTIRTGGPPDELASRISGRLNAIASAQDIFTQGTRHGVEVGPLIDAVVHPFCPAPGRLKVSGRKSFCASATPPPSR